MQLLILYNKAKPNGYANFLLQLLVELLSKYNIPIHQTYSVAEAKRIKTNSIHSAIIIHQNKPTLSFFKRLQLRSFIKTSHIQWLGQINYNSIFNSSLHQLFVIKNIEKWNDKKVDSSLIKMAVCSHAAKQKLVAFRHLFSDNVQVIPFAADAVFQPIDWPKKQMIKMQYSQGKEFFLVNAQGKTSDAFLSLLKAFSSFKKWQHSSMKLLVLGRLYFTETKEWQEKLNTYKYREDIVFVNNVDATEQTVLLACAYAFIHAPLHDDDVLPMLDAMQRQTPCISFASDSLKEYANEAAILIEQNDFEKLGEKMILLYKDETLRSRLIEKGIEQTRLYAKENALRALQAALPANLFG